MTKSEGFLMGGFGDTLKLLFEINADPEHAVAAMKLFEEQVASSMGVSVKSLDQFGAASVAAAKDLAYIGAGAVGIGTALFAAAEHAAHFAEEIGHVAEKSGATAEQVSTLQFAANRFGVTNDAVATGLRFLARDLGDIAEGSGKKAATAFHDLGINVHDAHGKVRAVSDVLPELIERLGGMEAGGRRTADAMAIFGRGGAALIPMLGEFRGGFKAIEDQARSMGLVIGKDDVEAGTKFLVAQRTMTAEVNAFTLLLGKTLLPVLTVLFVKLENFPIVMKEIGLSLAQLASYIAGPVGMLANWLIIEPKLTKAHKEMDQAMTDALVALDKEVHAALAAGIAHDLEGKAVTTATHAVKEHAAALRELAPVFPPVVEAMLRIQQSHAAEEIHAQAQALLDFGKAAQMPTLAIPPLAPLMAYTDGFKQLTAAQVAALPTEREIRTIHQDLAKLFPNMTQEEVDAKTAELARNTGLLQLIVQSAELTKGTKLYRQEMQQVIQTIRQLSGVEDPLVEKMREMLVTQQQVNQGMLQMADATMKAGFAAAMYGESIGRAMEKAAKAALASIAEQAGVNALNALAYGAWYLAQAIFGFGDPNAAAAAGLAFEAAAEWGAIAGVAGAAAAAMPSGGGGAGSSRGAAAGAGRGAGGGQAIERGGAGGGSNGGGRGGYSQTTIHIDGVISPDNMAQVFTQAGVGAGNGLFKFTASGVSGIPAPRA